MSGHVLLFCDAEAGCGGTIQIFNYGKCKRDFTYIDDIIEGVVRVVGSAPEKK